MAPVEITIYSFGILPKLALQLSSGVSFQNDGTFQILKWLFAITAGISAMRISTIARNETGKSKYFASVTDIFDYIEITRRLDGKIGIWFWIFVVSFTFFISLIIIPAFL